MDGSRFDDLARLLATSDSRRRLLGGIAAGALGLVRLGRANAAVCSKPGRVCREDANCCSKLCGLKDATGRRRCRCRSTADCPPASVCHAVACQDGICVTTVIPDVACDDGNPCTVQDTCSAAGRCVGTPVVCTPQDDCHQATCDRATGQCQQIPLTGTPCDDGNACTVDDVCASGVCAGTQAPVDCVVSDWSAWSRCSARCGGGSQQRTRTVLTPASCGGAACPSLTETQPCNTMACAACSEAQWNSNQCSNYTFVDGAILCTGGGAVGVLPCCASDADCPENVPFCVVSYTLALPGNALMPTVCPTDAQKGMCAAYVPCSVAP